MENDTILDFNNITFKTIIDSHYSVIRDHLDADLRKNIIAYLSYHLYKHNNSDYLMGHSIIEIDMDEKTIFWSVYQPFGNILTNNNGIDIILKYRNKSSNKDSDELSNKDHVQIINYKRKGIGTLSQLEVLLKLERDFGSKIKCYTMTSISTLNYEREAQLKRIGIEYGMEFIRYLAKTKEYIEKKGKKVVGTSF